MIPTDYKQTEAGVIPVDWKAVPLGEIIQLQRGFDLPHRLRKPGAVQIISSSGASGTHNRALVSAPGVVTGRYGTIGEVFYIEDDFWPLNTTLYVRDFKGNHPLYISFILRTIDFAMHSGKSGVPGVNRNDLHEIITVLPPLAEQQAVAAALGEMDALLAAQRARLAKQRAVKQGLLQGLLNGEKRLPGFAGKWEVKRLGSVLKFQVGCPFSSIYFNQSGDGIRLIKNRDLKSDDSIYYFSGPFSTDFIVHDNDVLIGMDGDFLPCLWNKGKALLNQRVGRVVTNSKADKTFCFHMLAKPLQEIQNNTGATTVKHLSHKDIENITLPMPEPDEQRAIAAVLSEADAYLAALEAEHSKTQQLKQGLMQQLLTGKLRLV